MPTLLLELFSEEIPSRMQLDAARQLMARVLDPLKNAIISPNIAFSPNGARYYVSPRHLGLTIGGLPEKIPDYVEERRGPKIGAPEQAIQGFLKSIGWQKEQLVDRDGYYYAMIERKGRSMTEVVKEIIERALIEFTWPKSMKWGARSMQWVRPLHKIVCLLDDKIIPVQFGHLTASNITNGHRFLAPGEIKITHAEKYEGLLADAKVMVDFTKRRDVIAQAIQKTTGDAKLALHEDDDLLNEVTGLVEHPVPLLCEFDAKFLDLPPEVLISEMKNHQRYFALYGADGKLTNRFITVANMVNADGGERVKNGNARVVRARLADGEFYWEQDRKVKLEDWGKKLSDVVFHAKVGMMNEKVARIEKLAVEIAKAVNFTDEKSVRRAAQLCKADLTSGMVGEFPELQGIMGRYYATAQGESAEIADAIRDHYKPLGANDSAPESKLAAIIAIADKLDSITSLFTAGEKPTGSKDPLALRRAALGINNILIDQNWSADLSEFASSEVIEFMADRLRQVLKDKGIRHDVISSTVSTIGGFNPAATYRYANEMNGWVATTAGKEALAAIKRSMNILAAEEKKSKPFTASTKNAKEPAEKSLVKVLDGFSPVVPKDLEALTAPINQFFTDLLVNEEGHREARLALLAAVREAANHIADFSKLEG